MAKRKTARKALSDDMKKARIENWAKSLGLDGMKIAETLIAKYGIDEAHKLAQDSMMKPSEVAKNQGVSFRSSKAMLEYLARDEAKATVLPIQKENTEAQSVAAPSVEQPPAQETVMPHREQVAIVQSKINNSSVEQNRQLRYQYIDVKFPQLNEKDFVSHDAYMSALRQQYTEMRQYEWEMVCQQEVLDMYNSSKNPAVTPNSDIWSGKFPRNENYCASDSTYCTQGQIPGVGNLGKAASCAGTATRINNAICERFGYEDSGRFYQTYGGCAGAIAIHDNPATRKYCHKNKSLEAMIEAGYVGAGTFLSVPSKATGGGSGYHAMTVADVIRDENGKITDIVLQGNNKTSLDKYSVEGIDNTLRRKYDKMRSANRSFYVTSAHTWAQERIVAEEQNISDAELEKRVAEERGCLYNSAERLAGIEDKSCRINSQYVNAVSKQGEELQTLIAQVQPIAGRSVMSEEAVVYSEQERASVRQALLGVDRQTYATLVEEMKKDSANADKIFETMMKGYFANNGGNDDKKAMKLASDLLLSFLSSENGKSLMEFHEFVENSTKTSDTFKTVMLNYTRGNSRI